MRVGITGHQDLGGDEAQAWVVRALSEAVDALSVTCGVSCLARGSDSLYAEELRRRGLPFVAVRPCARIEESFEREDDRATFRSLLAAASEVVTLPFASPSEAAYDAAGKWVVDHCDYLVAVWDGCPARGLGGTADVVRYAREQRRPVLHVDPRTRQVGPLPPAP